MSIASLVPARFRRTAAPQGTDPYANPVPAAQAVTRLRPETGPQPAFTPRNPVRATGRQPALPADGRPVAVRPADISVLARVRDAMDARWRAESFAADKRDLPGFNAVTRELGWQGLHTPARRLLPLHQRWTTERWMRDAMTAVAADHEAARAALDADIAAARDRVLAPRQQGGAR